MSSHLKYWLGRRDDDAPRFDSMIAGDIHTANEVEVLRRRVDVQIRQIDELSAALVVLLRMLSESQQLDLEVLQHRVDAELELRGIPEVPPGTCVLCGAQRPGEQLSQTAYGMACSPRCGEPK